MKEDLYEISHETIKPETGKYCSKLDPKNEAKKYTARSLFLIQPGVNVTNWCNFTLGIGVALSHNKYFMETAYGYTRYSFTKLDPSLPDIDDIYDYNNDGVVDAEDVDFLKKVVSGSETLPDGKIGDINKDGYITKDDVVLLKNLLSEQGNSITV